jgi:hypothetical protein
MNNAIYKYPLINGITPISSLELPKGAKILSAINQRENIVLYAHIDIYGDVTETFEIYVIGTGHKNNIPDDAIFLNTVSLSGGQFIFHVFYRKF